MKNEQDEAGNVPSGPQIINTTNLFFEDDDEEMDFDYGQPNVVASNGLTNQSQVKAGESSPYYEEEHEEIT